MNKPPPKAEAVVMGASAGALEAISQILPALPAGYPLPLIVVVHVPPDRPSNLASLFQAKCSLRVKEAEDKEPVQRGIVYVAPPNYHVLVEQDRILSLSGEEEVLFSRPSIDVLFESAADAFGAHLVGVILTGASADGAKGLRAVRSAGGQAIVQRPELAFASAMPEAALKECPTAQRLTLNEISIYLQRIVSPEQK